MRAREPIPTERGTANPRAILGNWFNELFAALLASAHR
jgi:hypothetical protein